MFLSLFVDALNHYSTIFKVYTNLCAPFFGDTTLVIRSCVAGVLTNVVWLSTSRLNLWILITNFILFQAKKDMY
jgi:hypothetical protein